MTQLTLRRWVYAHEKGTSYSIASERPDAAFAYLIIGNPRLLGDTSNTNSDDEAVAEIFCFARRCRRSDLANHRLLLLRLIYRAFST
jgi:hypothetical protein